jgi:hypothetical protein
MEQGNSSVRDRLLARLPQPENLAAYREETEVLLAKHERCIFWGEKFPGLAVTWLALAVWLAVNSSWGPKVDTNGKILLESLAGLLLFTGGLGLVGYRISRSKVDLLKEVKQLQLQVLEVQASLRKGGDNS